MSSLAVASVDTDRRLVLGLSINIETHVGVNVFNLEIKFDSSYRCTRQITKEHIIIIDNNKIRNGIATVIVIVIAML